MSRLSVAPVSGRNEVHVGPSPATVYPDRPGDGNVNVSVTKWLATQIPEFGSSEAENVGAWIRRVDKVSLIHSVPDGATLLAASSKLVKQAKHGMTKWIYF